jgi:hypothetical protein
MDKTVTEKQEEQVMKLLNSPAVQKFWNWVNRTKEQVGKFLVSLKNRMGIGSPERNAADTYERGMKIVPECIRANDNEITVKQYNVAVLRNVLKFERAEGRMQVTNRRVIFRAAGRSVGGRTALQHEFAVNEIAGIEARTNYKFSFLYLVFAVLIIASAFFVIYHPPFISGIKSPVDSQSARISSIMFPKHVQKVYSALDTAVSHTGRARENVAEAAENIKSLKEAEEKAAVDARDGIERTRRVQVGWDWWGNAQYGNQRYRDRSAESLKTARDTLEAAITAREKAEAEEQEFVTRLEAAREYEARAAKKMESTVKTWSVLMTILGTVLGIAGLIPFFALHKKFALKLFILNFSVFGFALSLSASGLSIFSWFVILSVITTFACIFIFCFRPNVVISIKNKTGSGVGPVDIRCNETLNRLMEVLSFIIVVVPVIIIWGFNTIMNSISDSIIGPVLQVILPVILLVIFILAIARLLQNKSTGRGLDSGFAEVIPTSETESAIREIGAMIGDIQKLGDLGLQKWIKD